MSDVRPTPLGYSVSTLPNGLRLVVHEDHSTPIVGVNVWYHVGSKNEQPGKTGFAHLFEHMMFEGTPNAPKGLFSRVIQGGGGVDNGSTRYDYTNYIVTAPVSALEPVLWLEADRMRSLDITAENLKNQKDVVKEEIRVNVKNRPYGLFFWTDISGLAFDKWENAHDGYGSFEDLDAAALEDVVVLDAHAWPHRAHRTGGGMPLLLLLETESLADTSGYLHTRLAFHDFESGNASDSPSLFHQHVIHVD